MSLDVPAGPATSPNALLIARPCAGTTILATALGLKAAHAGYRVYYTTAADLVARTTRSAIDRTWQTNDQDLLGTMINGVGRQGRSPAARYSFATAAATAAADPSSGMR
jgi:IstB-like ATP binding protein